MANHAPFWYSDSENVQDAIKVHKEKGNTYWYKAIQKEVKNVRVAFKADKNVTPQEARGNKKYVGYQ